MYASYLSIQYTSYLYIHIIYLYTSYLPIHIISIYTHHIYIYTSYLSIHVISIYTRHIYIYTSYIYTHHISLYTSLLFIRSFLSDFLLITLEYFLSFCIHHSCDVNPLETGSCCTYNNLFQTYSLQVMREHFSSRLFYSLQNL